MDALKIDERDFVTRQYAHLVASGLTGLAARDRLEAVLGQDAIDLFDTDRTPASTDATGAHLAQVAMTLDGNAADVRAAFIHALGEARLLALDWWRPVRTFLLYVLFLLGLAVVIALLYTARVLPAFSQLDQTLGATDGAAGWIRAYGALRLFAPLGVMAIVLGLLTLHWFRMRQRMARLEPVSDLPRGRWLRGGNTSAYRAMLVLEFASVLKAGGVADAPALEAALQQAGWPEGQAFQDGDSALGDWLADAIKLGTFDAELEWLRRLLWSQAQAQLEMSRDRLILCARVFFYILIGIMVTVLYIPIFTVASMVGVH